MNIMNRLTLRTLAFMVMMLIASGTCLAQKKQKKVPRNDIPHGTTAYYEQNIRAYFRQGEWNEGKLLCDTAIVQYPEMSAFNELMGRYLLHVGLQKKKQVDSAQRKAEAAQKKGQSGQNTTAQNAQKKNDSAYKTYFDKARYYLIRAITIDEKNLNARQFMLQLETEVENYSTAIVYCNELLEENPYNENLWRKKIDLYRKLGNNAEADHLLERLITIYPSDEQLKKDWAYRKEELAKRQLENGNRQGFEESLRQLIELEPTNKEHYIQLANLLYNTGRLAEAAEVAGRGAALPNSYDLIAKKAGILCELNRYQEAIAFVKAHMAAQRSPQMAKLLSQLEMDASLAAQMYDPYIARAKVYEKNKSSETLDYLISTAIQRGYLDDALEYIAQARKSHDTPKLQFKEYIVQKRLGNKQKANALLENMYKANPQNEDVAIEIALLRLEQANVLISQEQYIEAIPLLVFASSVKSDPELAKTARMRLYACYLATKQYTNAAEILESRNSLDSLSHYTIQKALLYNSWGKEKEALDMLAKEYTSTTDSAMKVAVSGAYEEIAVPYIKKMIASGMMKQADRQLDEALVVCNSSTEILHYGITTSQSLHKDNQMEKYIMRGKELFPDDPYYTLKEAQLLAMRKKYEESINILRPMLDTYTGDSLIVNAFAANSDAYADTLIYMKQLDKAMAVVDTALVFTPENQQLIFRKALIFEKMKDWESAKVWYKKYKPDFSELASYNRHMEEVYYHTMDQRIQFEYQQARLGNEDVITGNAYLTYVRTTQKNEYSFILNYAGRDGTTGAKGETELTKGGTGLQFGFAWQHDFTSRLTLKGQAAYATRYFPKITLGASGTYDLTDDWQLNGRLSYRMLKSYKGIYGWEKPVVGYDQFNDPPTPIYGEAEYTRIGWKGSYKSLLQLGAGATKTINQFVLGGGLDAFLLSSSFYYNGNLKMQFFPFEGNKSNFFATCGAGTAPESSLIDRSLAVSFKDLNTFVGMGAYYFINRWFSVGLDGTWFTMLSQSEALTTNYIENNAIIKKDYKNYFYWHINVTLSF